MLAASHPSLAPSWPVPAKSPARRHLKRDWLSGPASSVQRCCPVLLGSLPRPALERSEERRRLPVPEEERHLVGRELAVRQIGEGDGAACLVEKAIEGRALGRETSLQGSFAHPKLLRDKGLRRLARPEALGN